MKNALPTVLCAALLAACAVPQASAPRTAETPAASALAAPTEIPTAPPTAPPAAAPLVVVPTVTPDPGETPNYLISMAGEPKMNNEQVTWPATVTLKADWTGTLEGAAEAFGVPLETLRALNPSLDYYTTQEEDGSETTHYCKLLLQAEPYTVPRTPVKTVSIMLPWVSDYYQTDYVVPAALDDKAAIALAEGYSFLPHYGISLGYWPCKTIEENPPLYQAEAGARFTKFSVFQAYLQSVFTQGLATEFTSAHLNTAHNYYTGGFLEGEGDALCFGAGDRGTNILYCGTAFTKPELQPDGSLVFWQLSLQMAEGNFDGWGKARTYLPTVALASIIRLVSAPDGWRVADLTLPN